MMTASVAAGFLRREIGCVTVGVKYHVTASAA
jgi:hypothetical protein